MGQDTGHKNFRPLVPRGLAPDPPPLSTVVLPKRIRPVTGVACDSCRRRKTKCNGLRPLCSPCKVRGLQCVYATQPSETRISAMKRKHDELQKQVEQGEASQSHLQQLFDAIRDRNEEDAATIMTRIRAGQDPGTILRHLDTGDLLLQLHLVPETRFRNSFPAAFRIPTRLQSLSNVYFQSPVYEATLMEHSPEQTGTIELHDRFRPQYLRPYAAAELIDPRINLVKPSNWTNVLTDDTLMRNMLRFYFRLEHQSLPFFHKDYFLDDMLSGSEDFCSSLLVNAILAECCSFCPETLDRLEYWKPSSLRHRFMAEARRLWELEQNQEPRITTLQAAMVLNPVYNMTSMEGMGLSFSAQAIALSYKMGLLEPLPYYLDERTRHVYTFTAWCLYYWMSIQYYTYVQPPPFQRPPQTPLPDPEEHPEWYGDVVLRYPGSRVFAVFPSAISYCISSRATAPHSLQYHTFIINVCEFLISQKNPTLAPEAQRTVTQALTDSCNGFESIMLLFYLRHGYDMQDRIMTQYLSILAYMALKQLRGPVSQQEVQENRGILTIAAKGVSVQGKYYYLTHLVSVVLQGEMDPEDLVVLQQSTIGRQEDRSTENARAQHDQSQHPISIVSIKDRRLGDLVKRYSTINLQDHKPDPTPLETR
ncbi:nitrate assimilation regulatory protein nira [Fusarium flagelliforme]|uniref:Nitrate assimilation regulatory protein nira n=1 Tax=Fusarium flagelliforme TaxID=2675880 RepID=A0A395MS68_9HYPO|nr:nitrate assimilation regulatory protein nira [Fusarium flagelliforme]